jgi:hypothetical protein
MRSYLFIAVLFFTCTSFLNDYSNYTKCISPDVSSLKTGMTIFDFTLHRLSGERVIISWHTEGEQEQVRFEVMRVHGKGQPYISLGVVEPKSKEENSFAYAFIDINNFRDSSYYCLKKTNADSVVFYSLTKGVEGVGKER